MNALRIPFFGRAAEQAGREGRFWGAIVHRSCTARSLSLVLSAGLLLALAAPVFALDTGTSGAATLPDRFESKQGYLLLGEEFPKETTEPVEIAVAGEVRGPAVEGARPGSSRSSRAAHLRGAGRRDERGGNGRPRHGSDRRQSRRRARDRRRPRASQRGRPPRVRGVDAEVYVGGDTAEELDYHDTVNFWLPLVLLFVLGLSFLLLRSRSARSSFRRRRSG